MAEPLDLNNAGFKLDLEPFAIDLTANFELNLELVPVNLDCEDNQPADTGGESEPI